MATSDIKKGPLYVDSTNNRVGIGTSSPTGFSGYTSLDINNATNGAIIDLSQGNSMKGRLIATASTMSIETSSSVPIIFQPTGTEAMRIDTSGHVTMPYQPAFYARGSGVQNWSGTSVYQILQLNSQHSLGSRSTGYDTSTFTFTAPVTGTYVFFGRMTQTGTANGPSLQLFINGSSTVNEMSIGYGNSYVTVSGFQLVQLAANDAVTLQVINYNTTTFSLDLSRSAFMGWLLG